MAKIALLIGVGEYGPGLTALPEAEKDVEVMQQVLQPLEMGGFDEVKRLWNPNPPVMREAIEALFSNYTNEDLVLLLFSGYLIQDDSGQLYFATAITCKTAKAHLIRVSAIPASVVQNHMSNSPCQRQVVILNCCLSRVSDQEMVDNNDVFEEIKAQLGGNGRTILASLMSPQISQQSQATSPSVYTGYLVEGIKTGAADFDKDGWISVDELHEYATRKTQIAAPAIQSAFYSVENEEQIRLFEVPINDPKLKYRKAVERWINDKKIDETGRDRLNNLAQSLGLTSKDCTVIENEVLTPYHEYLEKLQRYKQEWAKALSNDYPLSNRKREELRSLQQSLELTDEDVAPIEEQMTLKLINLSQIEDKADQLAAPESKSESTSVPAMPSSILPNAIPTPPDEPNPTPASVDQTDEPTLIQSQTNPKLVTSGAKTVLQQSTRLLPDEPNPTPASVDQTDEPTLIQSQTNPKLVTSGAKTVLQQSTSILPDQPNPTPASVDQTDEPTLIQSQTNPKLVTSGAKTVLQQSTSILPAQPTNPTPASSDEPAPVDNQSNPNSVASDLKTVLQQATSINPAQPTNPTPAVKSSSLAGSNTNPPPSSFPKIFLVAIAIGGSLITVALAIIFFLRKPAAPPTPVADQVSASPSASSKSSPSATQSEPEPSPSPTASPKSKNCTIFVNGNVRSKPVSAENNVVEQLRERLPVTGKRTEDGWVQVKLSSGKLAWAHPRIITNESEKEMEACLATNRKTE